MYLIKIQIASFSCQKLSFSVTKKKNSYKPYNINKYIFRQFNLLKRKNLKYNAYVQNQ